MGLFDSIGDALFGDKPDAKIRQKSRLSPEQQNLLKRLESFLNVPVEESVTPFEGDLTAGASGLESLSLQALEQEALGRVEGGGQLFTQASDALSQILTAPPTDFEDFFQTNVESPLLETFSEEIQPRIRASNAKNFFSTGRQDIESRATEDLIQEIGRARESLAFQTREADRAAKLTAAGLVDPVTAAPINQAIRLLQAGRVPREIEQAGLTAEYQEFLRRQQQKSDRVRQLLQAIGVPVQENIALVTGGSSGILGPAAQGFAQGFASSIFAD